MIRVLIADDQDLVRAGFRMILDAVDGIEVVGEAGDGRDAVAKAQHLKPDVCLFDVRMPELDGIEATRLVAGPDVAEPLNVVVVTTFDTDEHVYGALEAGATGFLLKNAGPQLLIEAIRAAAEGDALLSPAVTTRLLEHIDAGGRLAERSQPAVALTDREEEVLAAVARGLTNTEIAELLFVSLGTVKAHLTHLMTKIGTRNRVELVIWAYRTRRVRP